MSRSDHSGLSWSLLKWLGVCAYFIGLTMIMTYPLVLKMSQGMVGEVGDNIYFVWMIGWVKKAVFELHVNPFDVWFLNYPQGWNMAYTEITPIMLILAIPFAFLSNATFAYNAAMMVSFVLSGIFMTLWVKRLTRRWDAALIAGTIYAFVPYHFAHFLIGHLNLVGIQWFPLYFMGLYELLEQVHKGERGWAPAVVGGIGLGLIAWTSQYYLYMVLFISLVFGLGYILLTNWRMFFQKTLYQNLFWMFLTALPLVGIAVYPYVTLAGQGGLPDRGVGIAEMYSAGLTDFFLPSTMHFIWGQWIGDSFNRDMWVEGTLYIGVVAFLLAAVALVKRRQVQHTTLVWISILGILTATVLAMGIDVHWNGEVVKIATPAFLKSAFAEDTMPIPLPGYFLFKYFPFFAKLRALMRFGVFNLVFFSALAGLGSAWILERVNARWKNWVTAGLLLLVLVDFFPRPFNQFFEVSPRPVDEWLAEQPDKGAVVQMPFVKSEDQEQTYYTLIYDKPFIGGFFNAFPPTQYSQVRPVLNQFPDESSVKLLKDLGAVYVIVDKASYPDLEGLKNACESLGLKFENELGDQWVFILR